MERDTILQEAVGVVEGEVAEENNSDVDLIMEHQASQLLLPPSRILGNSPPSVGSESSAQ